MLRKVCSKVTCLHCTVAYLTGLLQHQRHLRCPDIFEFLEFEFHDDVAAATNRYFSQPAEAANDDDSEEEYERLSGRGAALLSSGCGRRQGSPKK